MKKLLLAVVLLSATAVAHAQATSNSWIDVTVSPYFAARNCSADAGPAINSAIAAAPSGSGVIFFPTGCYLIQTQIVDANASAYLSYLGEGQVEFRAPTPPATPPSNSIIQFGNATTTVVLRKIVGIDFNCNGDPIDGIDLYGLSDSEFDNMTIQSCGRSQMATFGGNGQQNSNNVFLGGVINANVSGSNGIILAGCLPASVAWSFFGTKILGDGKGTGTGLALEGTGNTFHGGVVSGWEVGIDLATSACTPQGAFSISGAFMDNNTFAGIRVGNGENPNYQASGVTITGNFINCDSVGKFGVDLEQVNGFSITGNRIDNCAVSAIGTPGHSDNGFVGANFINGGQPVDLEGSDTSVTDSISTRASAYTLNGSDAWVNEAGSTTVTVPHAIKGHRWDVFNSGPGTVTLICDSGTINGGSSVSLPSQTGKSVTTDGTSCFAH